MAREIHRRGFTPLEVGSGVSVRSQTKKRTAGTLARGTACKKNIFAPRLLTGFTLIETLVAVFIVGVAITIFGIVGFLLKNTTDIRYDEIALQVANTKLDELREGGYDALPANGTFGDPLLSSLPSGEASTTVTQFSDATKKVLVGVSWQSTSGGGRYISLTTLVAEIGGL